MPIQTFLLKNTIIKVLLPTNIAGKENQVKEPISLLNSFYLKIQGRFNTDSLIHLRLNYVHMFLEVNYKLKMYYKCIKHILNVLYLYSLLYL